MYRRQPRDDDDPSHFLNPFERIICKLAAPPFWCYTYLTRSPLPNLDYVHLNNSHVAVFALRTNVALEVRMCIRRFRLIVQTTSERTFQWLCGWLLIIWGGLVAARLAGSHVILAVINLGLLSAVDGRTQTGGMMTACNWLLWSAFLWLFQTNYCLLFYTVRSVASCIILSSQVRIFGIQKKYEFLCGFHLKYEKRNVVFTYVLGAKIVFAWRA